jgi:hypothetical protein
VEGHPLVEKQSAGETYTQTYDYDYFVCRSRLPDFSQFTVDAGRVHPDPTDTPTEDFLRASVLLLDCLFTGCYVSKEIKSQILNEFPESKRAPL